MSAETAIIKKKQTETFASIDMKSQDLQCIFIFLFCVSSGKHSVVPDLSLDPTLPRTKKATCPKCGYGEAVFFQSHDKQVDSAMTLYFVCCNLNCNHCFVNDKVVQ